jgi:hypothetical protein
MEDENADKFLLKLQQKYNIKWKNEETPSVDGVV